MDDKKQFRRYHTDLGYRDEVRKSAEHHLNVSSDYAHKTVDLSKQTVGGREDYHPVIDKADLVADAILTELSHRSGIMLDFDKGVNHEIADTVAEIVRQGAGANAYDFVEVPSTSFDYVTPYQVLQEFRDQTPSYNASGEFSMKELRDQVFNAMIDKAIYHGAEPNYTPIERCLRTVRSVLGVIDGAEGNRPDGKGLPLFQLIPSPHPDYQRGRAFHHEPVIPDSEPLNTGLISDDYSTGMVPAFDRQYDKRFENFFETRAMRAAKDLFGKGD